MVIFKKHQLLICGKSFILPEPFLALGVDMAVPYIIADAYSM